MPEDNQQADQSGQPPDQVQAKPAEADNRQSGKVDREKSFEARHAAAAQQFALRHPTADGKPDESAKPEEKPATDTGTAEGKATEEKPKDGKSDTDLDKRYAVLERKRRSVDKRAGALDEREKRLNTAATRLEATFGDPVAVKDAYDKGEFHAAARALHKWLGDDFASITQKIARHTAGLSPEKLKELDERDAFQREKREFEAQKRKTAESQKQEVTRAQALSTVTAKATGHDALKLPNGADLVLRELESSWDPDQRGFRLTIAQAADRVVESHAKAAEALGFKKHQAKLEEKPKPEPKKSAPPTKAAAQVKHERLSFEERHALAGRMLAKKRGR